ncbi:MAG: DUF3179 domain-containing protein [Gemmatimonadetes bacterium]|nr:DUF3179 domain-containing protein [Gemmatimonadota bacterium]
MLPGGGPQSSAECSIPQSAIFDGGPGKDGIPALTDPEFVPAESPRASYLRDADRVIGVVIGGEPLAIPLNIGWWHEIVNLDRGGLQLAVTYCPLTGSSIAFDRTPLGGGAFGVSGLLYLNNLIMYDRTSSESLWPQMLRQAGCGPRNGTRLSHYPVIEMSWAGWKSLYPNTLVIGSATGYSRNYRSNPYGSYDQLNNRDLLFPIPRVDTRRPLKERVLGIPGEAGGGIAFPYGALDAGAAVRAVHATAAGGAVVVFWDRSRQAAMAFRPLAEGRRLSFEARDGRLVDVETGSTWQVDGRAVTGPLAGQRLEPVAEAFVAFWFGWAAFHPDTRLWTGA